MASALPTPEQKEAARVVANLRSWLALSRRARRKQGFRYRRVDVETELRRQEAIERGEPPRA